MSEISQALLTKIVGAEKLKILDALVDIFDYSSGVIGQAFDYFFRSVQNSHLCLHSNAA